MFFFVWISRIIYHFCLSVFGLHPLSRYTASARGGNGKPGVAGKPVAAVLQQGLPPTQQSRIDPEGEAAAAAATKPAS